MIYMMPLGAGVSKERANWAGFGPPDGAFWCCYGTGVESFAKLADGAYFESDPTHAAASASATAASAATTAASADGATPTLWISQFLPSSLRWHVRSARFGCRFESRLRAF